MPDPILTGEQAASEANLRLSARLPGFDPSSIVAIIQALVSAITTCRKPAAGDIQRLCREGSILTRLRLRRALRAEGFRPLSPELDQAMNAALEVGRDAQEKELAVFISHCCDGT
jgi:hypothetical protein